MWTAQTITAELANRGTLTLPAGVIPLTEPIVLANGSTLRGSLANNAPIGTTLRNDHDGPTILAPPELRFWTLERLRVLGGPQSSAGIQTESRASNFALRDLYVAGHKDGVKLGDANFLARLENVWSGDNRQHGFDVGLEVGYGGTGTTISLTACLGHRNGSWGMVFRNLWGLTLIGCAADANAHGGMVFRSTAGTLVSPTCESNPTGMWFWSSRMVVLSPTVDGSHTPFKVENGPVQFFNQASF